MPKVIRDRLALKPRTELEMEVLPGGLMVRKKAARSCWKDVSFWTGRLRRTYRYGNLIWMKKTLNIDDRLLAEAKLASGAITDTDTIRLGLEAVVRHAAYQRLRALRGTEPHALDVPRRREGAKLRAPAKRKVA